jgi:hypothetical protein
MPRNEMLGVLKGTGDGYGQLTLDDILRTSFYFGVSFEACYYRIKELAPRRTPEWAKAYRPLKRAQTLGLNHDRILTKHSFLACHILNMVGWFVRPIPM